MHRPGGSSHTPQPAHTLGGVSLATRMGCNLCTLQKREEHYKLLYEIAQVSETWEGGGDVSQSKSGLK